jgi:hypothetical protein
VRKQATARRSPLIHQRRGDSHEQPLSCRCKPRLGRRGWATHVAGPFRTRVPESGETDTFCLGGASDCRGTRKWRSAVNSAAGIRSEMCFRLVSILNLSGATPPPGGFQGYVERRLAERYSYIRGLNPPWHRHAEQRRSSSVTANPTAIPRQRPCRDILGNQMGSLALPARLSGQPTSHVRARCSGR